MHDEERFKKIFIDVAVKAVFSFFLHGVGRIKSRVEQNKKKLCIWLVRVTLQCELRLLVLSRISLEAVMARLRFINCAEALFRILVGGIVVEVLAHSLTGDNRLGKRVKFRPARCDLQ